MPKSVANKYNMAVSEKDLPESKGKEMWGGKWKDESVKKSKFKSLDDLMQEELNKNIVRDKENTTQITHGDAIKLVGNSTFRFLRATTKDMGDEDFKDVKFDNYTISIRKHTNDCYSGRVVDGHKQVHQWTNKTLPEMTAELMSIFEWYSPKDEAYLDKLTDSVSDPESQEKLKDLVDNYKKHNISNIYSEMEHIRSEIRSGVAVDLQQVEQKLMKLFDKLEDFVTDTAVKHNELARLAGVEIDALHDKLLQLQNLVEEMSKRPSKVEAFSTSPKNPEQVYNSDYMYLTKPKVVIHPSGKIEITFDGDWNGMDKTNFMNDMKVKALKKGK